MLCFSMKQYGLNSADYIKCVFIDHLLSLDRQMIIGNELMYGINRKLVDLVIIQDNRTTAIEIKSDGDNLCRLENQISEYRKIFNYVIVVSTSKFRSKLLESLPRDVGIYIVSENRVITKLRAPHIQKSNDKTQMLYSINAQYLKRIGGDSLKKYNADDIRKLYAKKSVSFIQETLIKYWTTKFNKKYKLFLEERGAQTHIEDLGVLSSPLHIE